MASRSELSKTMINAYRTAHYRVATATPPFVLLIKKQSLELAALMKLHDVTNAAFLTAYNPFSRLTDRNLNIRAHKALMGELIRMGLVYFEGAGEDPSGKWKSEPSFLVLGIPMEDARKLGDKYKQNAVVWADGDAVPQIILLR